MSTTKEFSLSLLKNIATDFMTVRATNGDADSYTQNGIYSNEGSMTGLPKGAAAYGILEVVGGWYYKEQHYYPLSPIAGIGLYRRMWSRNAGWKPWLGVACTEIK